VLVSLDASINGMPPEPGEFTALEAIAIPRRKTGVIVGLPIRSYGYEEAELADIRRQLRESFPDVTFQLMIGVKSVVFEWEVDE
jgi:hypothetical protein